MGCVAKMDRPLATSHVRRHRARQIAQVVAPLLTLVTVIVLLPGWMRPALTRARIRTAIVQVGPIEAVITASGTVVPEIERALSSPVDAKLLRLLKQPGAAVKIGEPVAELDLTESQLALERIAGTLAITDNKQDQARLELDRSLSDLDARIERKTLEAEILEQKAVTNQRLAEQGLASQQQLGDARLAARQAAIEVAQLKRERIDAKRSNDLQAEGLSLERASLAKEAAVARRTLDLATTRADRDGIVTWILPQEGTLVHRGEVIARIANLSSFRIDATASDVHSGRIRAGMPVNVAVNDTTLRGSIADVQPRIENNVVRFAVTLDERTHPVLRPNMRVDVYVVTDRRGKALTVRQGQFVSGSDRADVYVVRDGQAHRVAVAFGLRGADDIEITSGLAEGDEIVLSDMRDYQHLERLEVR
jgi:HlyD family secretion protein